MADLLSDGVNWLLDTLAEHVSRSVVYRRASSSATITVTLGQSAWEQQAADGSIIRVITRDYIYNGEEIPNFGLPQKGDEIVDSDGVYQVLPNAGLQQVRYLDTRQIGLRIHTKRRGSA
jgi:hypothetical protein